MQRRQYNSGQCFVGFVSTGRLPQLGIGTHLSCKFLPAGIPAEVEDVPLSGRSCRNSGNSCNLFYFRPFRRNTRSCIISRNSVFLAGIFRGRRNIPFYSCGISSRNRRNSCAGISLVSKLVQSELSTHYQQVNCSLEKYYYS